MNKTSSPRQLAFDALLQIQKQNAYSNLSIAGTLRKESLSAADRALFTNLVYGVTERKLTLDYNLHLYLKQPLKKLNPKVYTALLLGSYQLLFLDRIPQHAAINETVNLVKKNGVAFSAGLVNAVLRKIAEAGLCLPDVSQEKTKKEMIRYYSIKYSVPPFLVELWWKSYGEEKAVEIMDASLLKKPIYLRVNTTRITPEALCNRLREEGCTAHLCPAEEACLVLEQADGIERLSAYREGLFHVQDLSSQRCCAKLNPQPGDLVLDLCAAPGGKSFTMAERMQGEGTVLAFDLHAHRVKLIADGAARLGLANVAPKVGDATRFDSSLAPADKILVDVPCSGLGIIGRKPEIRYKEAASIDDLPALQYNIADIASRYLKPGGKMLYSTCSLNPAENEAVVARFLSAHPDFSLCSMETVFPGQYQSDGFFISLMEKMEH